MSKRIAVFVTIPFVLYNRLKKDADNKEVSVAGRINQMLQSYYQTDTELNERKPKR